MLIPILIQMNKETGFESRNSSFQQIPLQSIVQYVYFSFVIKIATKEKGYGSNR